MKKTVYLLSYLCANGVRYYAHVTSKKRYRETIHFAQATLFDTFEQALNCNEHHYPHYHLALVEVTSPYYHV